MKIKNDTSERHVLVITVDNEAGILAKIAGLFTARGYNIDSLTVADISDNHAVSRITIVTSGPTKVIDQIHAQLERLIPVHRVDDLTELGPHLEREMALVKLSGGDAVRAQALASEHGARMLSDEQGCLIFELTETHDRIDAFAHQMRDLGQVDVVRSGVVAMALSAENA